ncbi:MAG: hypothetical protein PHU71_01445 [Candidatus Gracilibacteria bacterium]|nr:hypothetical protein [Candidatus Gracilibacteria bacterium]
MKSIKVNLKDKTPENDSSNVSSLKPQRLAAMMLFKLAEEDYIAARILWFNAGATVLTRVMLIITSCLEKTMKAFLQFKCGYLEEDLFKLGHDLEKIRLECIQYNEFYNDTSLKEFCEEYTENPGSKIHQVLGYGSVAKKSVEGMSLGGGEESIKFLDRIFCGAIDTIGVPVWLSTYWEDNIANVTFYNPEIFRQAMREKNDEIDNILKKGLRKP